MKIIAQDKAKMNKKEKGVIEMKKMVILGLVVGMLLAIGSQAFAMVQKQPLIEKDLSQRYQNPQILL